MNISTLKVIWCYLTGGGSKVIDYVLDIANNAVNGLNDSSKAKVAEVLAAIDKILATARTLYWMVPGKWQPAYADTLAALSNVRDACSDLTITTPELNAIVTSWMRAYSSWRAE